MDWKLHVVYCVVIGLILLIVLLQMFYIAHQQRIKAPSSSFESKELNTATQNSIRLYSIYIDVLLTKSLNTVGASPDDKTKLDDVFVPGTFNVPQNCNDQLISADLYPDQCTYLVLLPGNGTTQLISDLNTGSIRYVVFANQVYFAAYDPQVISMISPKYSSSYIILLYTMISVKQRQGNQCSFNIIPFYGAPSSLNTEGLISKLPTGLNKVPMQVIGYQ
jgi:hypothetical protein